MDRTFSSSLRSSQLSSVVITHPWIGPELLLRAPGNNIYILKELTNYCPLYQFHSIEKMANRPKSSAQRSRSPSPPAEEVIESQEELLNSEHEENLEVSFHPHHVLPAPSNPADARDVHALH